MKKNRNTTHSIFKPISIFLLAIFFCAFFLRSYLISQNLFFGPEQGIDFFVIKQIAMQHKLTLIGSKTDIAGIFHGPIYYYLAAVPFFFSHGDPLIISLFFIFLNCLTVFFMFDLGQNIANKRVGIIAALLFSISWICIIYARWLSNPPLAIPLSALFFVFLFRFLKGNKPSLIFAAATFGLLNQAEFLNILFFFVIAFGIIIFWLPIFKKQNKLYLFFCGLTAVFTSLGSYILFDLKHQFLISKSIFSLAKGQSGYHISFFQAIPASISAFFTAYERAIFPSSSVIALFLFIGSAGLLLYYWKNKKEFAPLLLWFFLPPLILIILHHAILDQFFVALLPVFVLLTALLIDFLFKKSMFFAIILLSVIILSNFIMWYMTIPQSSDIFFQSTQPDLHYSDELKTIDTIYQQAHGKPFTFQAYTIPYWEQQAWQYLFLSYGQRKYGYQPVSQKANLLFVIIQNDPGSKAYQQQWLSNTVSKWGKLEKTFHQGALEIEKLRVQRI